MKKTPKIIVITPVRNEAWVLDAFLTCTSEWADHIIIADQHSTDNSREIASKFSKVTLVENNNPEMNQASARALLFKHADMIKGDKIIFAMDADEFLSWDFEFTEDWKTILESKTNSIFCFQWINLIEDYSKRLPDDQWFPEWACHFEESYNLECLYKENEQNAIHESRIPCIPNATYTKIHNIKFIHLARINQIRTRNKNDFYQVSTLAKLDKHISAVSLFRSYNQTCNPIQIDSSQLFACKSKTHDELLSLIDLQDVGEYYIEEINQIIMRMGIQHFKILDIWDNPYIKKLGHNDPRTPIIKLLHLYLKKTQSYHHNKLIKVFDKILKRLF